MSENLFNTASRVDELATLLQDLLGGRPVALLDWPNHANSGDHFIWLGEKVLLKQRANLEISYECAANDVDFERLSLLPPDAAIVFHGGGNFGDLYGRHQRLREAVIAAFPEHRIVLMPQTVHYESEARLRRSASVLRQHPDLHVMARDRESLQILQKKMGLASCYLMIDPAFALQPIVNALVDASPPVPERDAVYLTRRDRESLSPALGAEGEIRFDWAGTAELPEFTRVDIQAIEYARDIFDGKFDAYSWERLCKAIQLFKAGSQIVTDRLHGHILAMMMGKPHHLYDNSYGKNEAFFRSWTHSCDLVRFIPSETRVKKTAATPRKNKISGLVISYNRVDVIETCLRSLRFVDELIVVDKSSDDGTVEIARHYADKVVVAPWSPVVEDTRAQVLDLCSHEFIVCLDDDECLSPEAIKFILREIENPTADIYRLPVRSYILGRFDERRADWPDHKDKFFRRGSIAFSNAVHVGPETRSSKIQEIAQESPIFIHHFSVPTVENWIEKVNRYTSQPMRVGWVDRLPLSTDLPRQSVDHWLRKGYEPDDYLTAFVLSRMIYDIVDKLKRWEDETKASGEDKIGILCKVLQYEYDKIEKSFGISTGSIQPPS